MNMLFATRLLKYCTAVMVYRHDAAQRVNDVLLCVKRMLQCSPDCFSAIAKIFVQLLLSTDDNSKVTKPLIQVHACVPVVVCHCCFYCHI